MAGHPLRPATHRRLDEPLPHQQADRPRGHPVAADHFLVGPCGLARVSGISHSFPWLFRSTGQVPHVLLTRSPVSPDPKVRFSLDLHVLGAPPAFVLSQDQTLHWRSSTCVAVKTVDGELTVSGSAKELQAPPGHGDVYDPVQGQLDSKLPGTSSCLRPPYFTVSGAAYATPRSQRRGACALAFGTLCSFQGAGCAPPEFRPWIHDHAQCACVKGRLSDGSYRPLGP